MPLPTPDKEFVAVLPDDGGLAIKTPGGIIVDQVGTNPGSAYQEGVVLSPPVTSTKSWERKPGGSFGSCQDLDDNETDFQIITPNPQNLASVVTPCAVPASCTTTTTTSTTTTVTSTTSTQTSTTVTSTTSTTQTTPSTSTTPFTCCPGIPQTICATFPSGQGCPCLDGEVVYLIYNSSTGKWVGDKSVCSDENMHIEFECISQTCAGGRLNLTFENHGSVGPAVPDSGCSCSPLNIAFSGIDWPTQGAECDGVCNVVISECPVTTTTPAPTTTTATPTTSSTTTLPPSPERVALGTITAKPPGTTTTISGVTVNSNELLVVSISRHSGFDTGLTVTFDGNSMNQDVTATNGAFAGFIFSYQPGSNTTGDIVVTNNSASGSIAVAASKIKNLASNTLDQTASSTGSDTDPTSGFSGTTATASEMLIGCVATRGPSGDSAGSWVGVPLNDGQRVGTTGGGDASNATVSEGYAAVTTTNFYSADKSGITSRDWVALLATYQ